MTESEFISVEWMIQVLESNEIAKTLNTGKRSLELKTMAVNGIEANFRIPQSVI